MWNGFKYSIPSVSTLLLRFYLSDVTIDLIDLVRSKFLVLTINNRNMDCLILYHSIPWNTFNQVTHFRPIKVDVFNTDMQ